MMIVIKKDDFEALMEMFNASSKEDLESKLTSYAKTSQSYVQPQLVCKSEECAQEDWNPTPDDRTGYDGEGYMTNDHKDYDADEHIIRLINEVTVNTLTKSEVITLDSAHVLATLNGIKLDLVAVNAK